MLLALVVFNAFDIQVFVALGIVEVQVLSNGTLIYIRMVRFQRQGFKSVYRLINVLVVHLRLIMRHHWVRNRNDYGLNDLWIDDWLCCDAILNHGVSAH